MTALKSSSTINESSDLPELAMWYALSWNLDRMSAVTVCAQTLIIKFNQITVSIFYIFKFSTNF